MTIAATARHPRSPFLAGPLDPKRGGFTLVFLLVIAFMFPDVLSLNIGTMRLPPVRIGILLLFVPALLLYLTRPGPKFYSFDIAYLLFGMWTVISIIVNRGILSGYQVYGVFILEYIVIYILFQGAVRSVKQITSVLNTLILAAMVLGVLSAIEAITHNHFLMNAAYRFAGLGEYGGAFFGSTHNNTRLGMLRATSIFNHPILFGLFSAAVFPFAWYLSRNMASRLMRSGMVLAGVFFSLSSGPYLALMIQALLIGTEWVTRGIKNRFRIFFSGIMAFLVTVHFVAESGVYRLVQFIALDPGSTWYRRVIWQQGMLDVRRSPLFGIRPEEWSRLPWMSPSLDNHWLLQALIGGVPSVIFLGTAMTLIARRLFERPDNELPQQLAQLRRAWAAAALGMVVCGSTVAFFEKIQPLFAIMIAIGAVVCRLIHDWETAARPMLAAAGARGEGAETASDRHPTGRCRPILGALGPARETVEPSRPMPAIKGRLR